MVGNSSLNSSLTSLTRALSLESLIASAAVAIYAAHSCHIALPLLYYLGLLSVTWMVYLVDHLLDSMNLADHAQYHRNLINRHFLALVGLCLALAAVGLYSGWQCLDSLELSAGIALGLVCCLYFLGLQLHLVPPSLKELLITTIYVSGTCYVPLLRSPLSLNLLLWTILPIFLSVYVNMLTCSLWDFSADGAEGRLSTVQYLGVRRSRLLILALTFSGTVLALAAPASRLGYTLPLCVPLFVCGVLTYTSSSLFRQQLKAWLRMLADLSYLSLLVVIL
jgi:1,4-dihydroxy-2-naphthoate octaprenyltransferase